MHPWPVAFHPDCSLSPLASQLEAALADMGRKMDALRISNEGEVAQRVQVLARLSETQAQVCCMHLPS